MQLTPTSKHAQQMLLAISQRDLSPSTRRQYTRAVERAVAAGVNLNDAESVTNYAATLTGSNRAFLRAAVRTWANRAQQVVKGQATPDNIAEAHAAVYRLEALSDAIKLKTAKGRRTAVWLSQRDVKRLLSLPDQTTNKGRRDRIALVLMIAAGLRRNEAATLTWDDVMNQGDRCVLSIRGKGDKRRTVPISTALCSVLQEWRTHTNSAESDRVLRSVGKGDRIGRTLSTTAIYDIVQSYGAQIGKNNLQPHDLRRTYAQIGLDAGVPIQQISKLLGHESLATTQRYLNLDLDLETTISDFVPIE